MPKNKKLALNSGIQTNQILTNDDEVCIPHVSSILLAVSVAYRVRAAKLGLHMHGTNRFFQVKKGKTCSFKVQI